MFNPVSFRRILAQWNAKVQQEEAQTRFQQIEKELGIELWHRVPIVRIFPDEAYAELWNERAEGDHEVSEFLETLTSSDLHESVIAPFGAGRIPNAGGSMYHPSPAPAVSAGVHKAIGSSKVGKWRMGARTDSMR